MKYVTAAQMKAIDKVAIERCGVPAATLMENAGSAVALEAMKGLPEKSAVAVFSGYGNNGGDGLVAARYLINSGHSVTVYLVGQAKQLSPESAANLTALKDLGSVPLQLSIPEDIDALFGAPLTWHIAIDAIFGTGMRGPLDTFYEKLITSINASGQPVVAVDIPSGLDADTGEPVSAAIKAAVTVTLGFPKTGFTNAAAREYTGELVVADIGIPAAAAQEEAG